MLAALRPALFTVIAALTLGACTSPTSAGGAQAGSLAGEVGSPSRGLAYAEDVCAGCHGVAAGQSASPNPAAPTFEAIANTPGMTGVALSAWLHSPHPSMPSLIVDSEHIDDLSAYLAMLDRRD